MRILLSLLALILSIAALSLSSYAWYGLSAKSGENVIMTVDYAVTATLNAGEPRTAVMSDGAGVSFDLTSGAQTLVLNAPSSDASHRYAVNGFALLTFAYLDETDTAQNVTYYKTLTSGVDATLSFSVTGISGVSLTVRAHWGAPANFGTLTAEAMPDGAVFESSTTASASDTSALTAALADPGVTQVALSAAEYEVTPAQFGGGKSISGQGADQTTLKIVTTDGDGLKITSGDNVTISGVLIDGSDVTSSGYNSLINVERDGVVISDCVFSGGGADTWNSYVLVETLPAGSVFTIRNCVVSGSFRGILRESCSADIVIDQCDIDAVYPFNIDGGSTPSYVTVTNSRLHGWSSYSSISKATFENTEFSKGASGYDCVAAYVDTEFKNCSFDSEFDIYAQTAGFTFTLTNCTKNGVSVTAENFKELFPNDADVWNKCTCIVNGTTLEADA